MTTNTTPAERYQAVQQRAQEVNNQRVKIEAELGMLRTQHTKTVARLTELGVDDLSNVPALLQQKEEELDAMLTSAETALTTAEEALAHLNA